MGFGSQVECQVDQQIDHVASCWQVGRSSKNLKKLLVFQCVLVPRPSNFEAKLTKKLPQADQNSNKNLVSILIPFLMDFGTNLGRFWKLLAAKLEPCWHQMAPEPDHTTNQKNNHFLESLRNEFESIFGGFWVPHWRPCGVTFVYFL